MPCRNNRRGRAGGIAHTERAAREAGKMDLVILEQMMPEKHLLQRIDRAVDFGFIHEPCAPLYCADDGRPAIDLEILFRMLFVGYLYGIKSEARLEGGSQLQHGIQMVLRIGTDGESARRDGDQSEPQASIPGQQHYGKYRFSYNWEYDFHTCSEHHHLYWKTTTCEGYRQYFCDSKTCS